MPRPQESDVAVGCVFRGAYEILAEAGEGSFGRVFRARQLSTGQLVAIKILRFREGDSQQLTERQTARFQREMKLCADLSHPHIVRLIDSGESEEGALYVIFEYVPGATLEQVLAEEGPRPLHETLHLMTQVLDALACSHQRGVVHRDLKPSNIMITKTGARRNAMVLDFGLGGFSAELPAWDAHPITMSREMLGTPGYSAPEQLRGEPPTPRSDLYSWGLIFLECLTGKRAVEGESMTSVIRRQHSDDPIPIPEWLKTHRLGRLLQTVTAREPERRNVTIEGMFRALELADREGRREPAAQESVGEGERRQLTIVCCRLVVTGRRSDELDLEERDELLGTQHALCGEVARRNGGDLAARLGDNVLLQFGYPLIREDDARRAARTALEILEETGRRSRSLESERRLRLDVRIGIHTGLVITRELREGLGAPQPVVGATPEVAAQLAGLAGSGEILLSEDTQRLLRGSLRSELVGEHALGALSRTLPVFRLHPAGKASASLAEAPQEATPLFGRKGELSQLEEAWRQVQSGSARALQLSGEAGIGKSRLVRELRRASSGRSWLECRCLPENQDSPLRPVVDLLTPSEEPIESLLGRAGLDLEEHAPLFRALLGLPVDYAPLPMSRERQKDLTLDAIVALLLGLSRAQPVVFVVEDLQWADPTTLELIARLAQELHSLQVLDSEQGPRVLALLTARSEFTPPWSTDEIASLQLARLSRGDVEGMVRAGLSEGRELPDALLDQAIQRADGVPLFVEEVMRVLIGTGGEAGSAPEIPASLRNLLMARLDGLSPDAVETAQLASTLGREFRYELLCAASPKDSMTVQEDLSELSRAGLIFQRRVGRSESYLFKHALLRDAAYESMLRSVRRQWHGRIAQTIRERFPDDAEQRPELLAQHFGEAGRPGDAVGYWKRAGDRATARGAYLEAIRHAEKGIELVDQLPDPRERGRNELELTESLGNALLSTRGYAAPELQRVLARARELCDELGDGIPLRVLWGTWGVHLARSDREATAQMLPLFLRRAETSGDPVSRLAAHTAVGGRLFLRGEFKRAREEMERAIEQHPTEEFQAFVREYGYDIGLYAFSYLMGCLFVLGYPDQSREARSRVISIAEQEGSPFSLAIALGFAMNNARDMGEVDLALQMAERQIAFSTEQRIYFWVSCALCTRGWALSQSGRPEEGIAQMRQGLGMCQAIGLRAFYPQLLTGLVEGLIEVGDLAAGSAAADEGLAMCETLLDRWQETELLRLKGELLHLEGDAAGAERYLRRALELARERGARAYELRSATGLARLLRERGDMRAASALLTPIHDGFREGFETRDLRAAQALLGELGRREVAIPS